MYFRQPELILDKILGMFSGFVNTQAVTLVLGFVAVIGVAGLVVYNRMLKPQKKVLYCSESENRGHEFSVNRETPAMLYSKKGKDPYRFIRYAEPFNFEVGTQIITRWFAKRGTAFTKRLQEGEIDKEYTLYEIMKHVWGNDTVKALKDKEKQKLIESEVKITVRLEPSMKPEGFDKNYYETIGTPIGVFKTASRN